ncbi:MAG: WYL domain-containing protein [Pseudohongiellaceae bacterium]
MDRLARIYHLDRELKARRHPVSVRVLAEVLECSERNVKHIITRLRDAGIPIRYDRERNGYFLDRQDHRFELPGLWLNASELHALMISHHLLAEVQPGWLNNYIAPLQQRIEKLLTTPQQDFQQLQRRVRILQTAARPARLDHFQQISEAVIARRRLYMLYHGRERDRTTERTVSPQRLVYYRDNWYLDAWCHEAQGLRSFSIDRLHPAAVMDEPAIDVDDAELDDHYTQAYGIFSGKADQAAHLLFSPEAAKWVADESWHPRQRGHVHPDGRYELHIPYGDPRELIMDILKFGPEVEVLGPKGLREEVANRIRKAARLYGICGKTS